MNKMNFIEELRWRGMLHDIMPGTEEHLKRGMQTAYVGIDPTADSLHIGHLVSVMMLKHFQLAGHKPVVLIGGATGMIGDPSGKSEERKFLSEDVLLHNQECIKKQLYSFLDFNNKPNSAEMLNNYDWTKDFTFLNFLRDIGKHITVNYMMAKDSVKKRLEGGSGISFTEFSYQLLQAYDFLWLYLHKNCSLQMGGSDQWGNITTGTELIRRKTGEEAFALTCPLITKSDGGKFGKTEEGNVWLDAKLTSPYKFYQFWLNCSDEDASRYIRIFTLYTKNEVDTMVKQHMEAPHLRLLQKALAKEVTIRVHSEENYEMAKDASEILFGKGTADSLKKLNEELLLNIFEGVPTVEVKTDTIKNSPNCVDFLTDTTGIMASKNEARRMLKEGSVQVNKTKVNESFVFTENDLINNKYILIQKGKKNYFLIRTT